MTRSILPPRPLPPEADDGGRLYLSAWVARLPPAELERLRPALERAEAEHRIKDAFFARDVESEKARVLRAGAPKISVAEIEGWGLVEREQRAGEIAAAIEAKTLVPKSYGRRANDRAWTLAQLEAEELGPPSPPPPVHYVPDLLKLPVKEREAVVAASARGEVELVEESQGRRTYLERVAAVKAEHERRVREYAELTGEAPPPPPRRPPEDLSQRTAAELADALMD